MYVAVFPLTFLLISHPITTPTMAVITPIISQFTSLCCGGCWTIVLFCIITFSTTWVCVAVGDVEVVVVVLAPLSLFHGGAAAANCTDMTRKNNKANPNKKLSFFIAF